MITTNFQISRVLAVSALLGALLVPVWIGSARGSEIPPGFSVVDQYTDAFPGVGGDKVPPAGGNDGKANFPKETVDQFTQAGSDGVSALNLAAAGSPEGALAGNGVKRGKDGKPGQSGSGSDQSVGNGPADIDGSREVAKQVFGVAGSDGMGIFLPLIMVLAVLLGGFYIVSSKRSAF